MRELLKMLIVDDELLTRTGIRYMVDWAQYGFRIVGEAGNGAEALDIALREKPNVVITDVRMPGMNGVELTKILRKELPEAIIYVISGFDDFQQVREAFLYGASDFLLKSDLKADTLPELIRSRFQVSPTPSGNISSQFLLLSHLEREDGDGTKLLADFQKTNVRYEEGISFTLFYGTANPASHKILQHLCEKACMFEKTAAAVTPGMTLCVLTQGTEAKEKTEKALAESSKGNDDEYRCSFVLSEPFSDLGALRRNWLVLCERAHYTFYLPQKTFIYPGDEGHEEVFFQRCDFLSFLSHSEFGEAHAVASHYLSQCIDCRAPDPYILKKQVEEQFILAMQALEDCGISDEHLTHIKLRILRQVDFSENHEVLEEVFEEGWRQILTIHMENTDEKAKAVFSSIRNYINEHCCEEIRLSDVANACSINYNYLSTLFNQSCGISFSHYLQKARIERAKEYLRGDPSLPLSQVSAMVGLSDQSYFTKLFHKYEHCTPKQYLRRITGG